MAIPHSSVEYQDIPEFPGYQVGNDGSVWSCKNGRWGWLDWWIKIKPQPMKSGHLNVKLRKNGSTITKLVHHLVLETFVGQRPVGMECLHEDGNPANNNLSNIRWGTRKENAADRARHGTDNKGERNGQAKLCENDVQEIKLLDRTGKWSQQRLATKFDISRRMIRFILSGHSWKHIK